MVDLNVDSRVIRDIELVIFDKDGTLMELYYYWSQMVALRARLICEQCGLEQQQHEHDLMHVMGVDVQSRRLRPQGPVGLKKREIVLQAAVDYLTEIGIPGANGLCNDVFDEIDRRSLFLLDTLIKPIEGASSLLRILRDSNCKVAIATTDRGERARLAMDFLGFGDRVDLVVGVDGVSRPKPDPEMIHVILETLRIDRSNTATVGDALTDVKMGLNAGLKASIGVLTGFGRYEEFAALTPYIAHSVAGIKVMRKGDV